VADDPTRTGSLGQVWPGLLLVSAMALAVTLPPRYLAMYVIAGGGIAAIFAVLRHGYLLADRWFVTIFGCFVLAALFCLLGTLPVTQLSDIDLEFLKYAVYAAGFLVGLLALRSEQLMRRFVGLVVTLIVLLFVIFAVRGGPLLRVDQSWPIYPPDQNNSVAVMIVLAAGVIGTTPVRSRMFLLFVLAVFMAFFESRIGLIVVFAMILLQLRVALRLTLLVLAAAIGVWAYMSYGPLNPQTKLIFAAQNVVGQIAEAVPEPLRPEPAAEAAAPAARPDPLPLNRPLLELGTDSDISRLGIYRRALALAVESFPNLLGMGDAAVVAQLNDPPITRGVVFQHAHNFLLQSYLAYGLLATLALVCGVIAMLVLAISRRAWGLIASLLIVGGLGLIESLTSDIRVLTIISAFLGGQVGLLLRPSGQRTESRIR
jgi:hypothetical protein